MSAVAMMADDLATSFVKLTCETSCALTLIAAGWRGSAVNEHLQAAMTAAQNMARSGDAPPDVSGTIEWRGIPTSLSDVSSRNLPDASASGPFGAAS
jgi:hypothetical protein